MRTDWLRRSTAWGWSPRRAANGRPHAQHYERSLAVFQAAGDLYGQVQALTNLGNVAWLLGDHQQGRGYHEEALALARDLGDAHLEGQVLTSLGDAYSARACIVRPRRPSWLRWRAKRLLATGVA